MPYNVCFLCVASFQAFILPWEGFDTHGVGKHHQSIYALYKHGISHFWAHMTVFLLMAPPAFNIYLHYTFTIFFVIWPAITLLIRLNSWGAVCKMTCLTFKKVRSHSTILFSNPILKKEAYEYKRIVVINYSLFIFMHFHT